MNSVVIKEGRIRPHKGKIAIVVARFNQAIVDSLLQGALETLARHGYDNNQIEVFRVPGAYEIPLLCKQLTHTKKYSGLVALGAVIRGETAHFDFVAGGCAQGISQIMLATGIPIIFGVITTENLEQAWQRAGTTGGNRGSDAAVALLEMMDLLEQIHD